MNDRTVDFVSSQVEKLERLREQNAELLGALRRLIRWGQTPLACPDCGKVEDCLPDCSFEHAVAVIAKAGSDAS